MTDFLTSIHAALGLPQPPEAICFTATGALPSTFAVTELACASIAAAGLAVAELLRSQTGRLPALEVDRRLASFWFTTSLRPVGWSRPTTLGHDCRRLRHPRWLDPSAHQRTASPRQRRTYPWPVR